MPREKTTFLLTKNSCQPCENFFHDGGRNIFQASAGPRPQIQGARLIATHHPCGACAAPTEGYGETGCTGEVAAAGNRQDHGNLRHPVELVRRNHQNRTCPLLLVPFGRVKGHQIDVATPHQINSLPAAVEAVHAPSSLEIGAEASHWASNSCRLYFFLTLGSMIRRPDSTAMLTADPDSICSISRIAGGTANITEPPTLLKLLVYIAITWLQHYPEKLNHIAAELCVGNIRKYSLRLLTFVKLVFTAGLLVPCVCDAFGIAIRDVYSLIMIGLILVVTAYYEYRIFQEIKSLRK